MFLCKGGHGCRGAFLSVLATRSRVPRDPPVAEVNLLEPLHFEGRAQVDVDLPDRIGDRTDKLVRLTRSYNQDVAGPASRSSSPMIRFARPAIT